MQHLYFNHWALLAVAVGMWLLGAVWFSPVLFLKPWLKALGREKPKANPGVAMAVSLIADLFVSFILAHFVAYAHAESFAAGAFIGLIAWLGLYLAPYYSFSLFEETPFKLVAINAGYWLVCFVVAGGVLAAWAPAVHG